jgi:hypothetical protein
MGFAVSLSGASAPATVDTSKLTPDQLKLYNKYVKQQEKGYQQDLKKSMDVELNAIRENMTKGGATKADIDAVIKKEKSANAIELKAYETALAADGFQAPEFRHTKASTYDAGSGYGKVVQDRLDGLINFRDKYKLPLYGASGSQDSYGISLHAIDNYLMGKDTAYTSDPTIANLGSVKKYASRIGHPVSKSLARLEQWDALDEDEGFNTGLTQEQIAKDGNIKSIKSVKGSTDMYKVTYSGKSGGGDNSTSTYFQKNADGTYKPVSINNSWLAEQDEGFLGGFGGVLLSIGLMIAGVPGILSEAIAGGAATLGSSIASGAIIGGGTAALTGGDIGKGILLGGVGGGVSYGLNNAGSMVDSTGAELANSSAPWNPTGVKALDAGIRSAVTAGVTTIAGGGDAENFLTNSLVSGVSTGFGVAVGQSTGNNLLSGVTKGVTQAVIKDAVTDDPSSGGTTTTNNGGGTTTTTAPRNNGLINQGRLDATFGRR